MTQAKSSHAVVMPPSPGYLMAPFGWATQPLVAMLEADPSLYRALFTLNRQRMHLIALALAHWPGETDPSRGRLLLGGASAAVLDSILDRRPAGLKRALGRLPISVLPPESYRHLIELLDDPAVAKLIYHVESLTGDCICLLHDVPAPLRRIVALAVDDSLLNPTGLMDGLRFLASRGAAPSFDALVAELGAIRQPAQMMAHIANLVRHLPLPEPIPPVIVGGAHRLDSVTELRRLAKRWKNCLAGFYLDAVDNGRAAVYLWPDAETPAACLVARHGRLGWALEDAKGPENAELPPARLEEIHRAFAAVGIPTESAIEALENAARALERRERHRRAGRRRREEEYDEMYEEFEAA
jgi:hypothetical protein